MTLFFGHVISVAEPSRGRAQVSSIVTWILKNLHVVMRRHGAPALLELVEDEVPTLRRVRRRGGVCLLVSPPALRPPPVPADTPVVCGHKVLLSIPGFRYNPHILEPSGSIQPNLPGGLLSPVVGPFRAGPAR